MYVTKYSMHFTIKLHHDEDLDESLTTYIGGKESYFNNYSIKRFYLMDLKSMCSELGMKNGTYDLRYCIPQNSLEDGMMPIENDDNVLTFLDLLVYSTILEVYTTHRKFSELNCEWDDFSFTQFIEDEKEERVGEMI